MLFQGQITREHSTDHPGSFCSVGVGVGLHKGGRHRSEERLAALHSAR